MTFTMNARSSDSRFIDLIWQTHSEAGGTFIAPALSNMEILITKWSGGTSLTLWGPTQIAMSIQCPAGAEVIGIRLTLGTFAPSIPILELRDANVLLDNAIRIHNQFNAPYNHLSYNNAEMLVDCLAEQGFLRRDPIIDAVLHDQPADISLRSVQRRFQNVVGLSQRAIQQIERAQRAEKLLESGVSIPDTVFEAGYFDQPHLTRSLTRLIGKTPAEIAYADQGD